MSALEPLTRRPPASEEALAKLEAFAETALPSDYLAFLRESDGAEGWLREGVFVQLWQVEDVIGATSATLEHREPRPLLFFGGDGAREMFCFDLSVSPPDVLMLDITYASEADSPWRIRSFTALISHLRTRDLFDPPV